MTEKRKVMVNRLIQEILGKLDANEKVANVEVLASVVRQYIFEKFYPPEREEMIDRFCNLVKI